MKAHSPGSLRAQLEPALASNSRSTPRGLFVAIDGIDACGKGKTIRRIRPRLEPAVVVSCPNRETRTGKVIKGFLSQGMEYPRMAQIAVFEANRWEWAKTIHEARAKGRTILANRWYHSGMAYAQASGEEYLEAVLALVKGAPEPDLSIILDITTEESYRRKPRPTDRESLDMDPVFLEQVRQNFLGLAKRFGWAVIDGMADPDEVAERVMKEIGAKRPT